jgi:SAM-dependent methyltransferase
VDWFGEDVAATYDADEADRFAPAELDPTVALLVELAAGGPALELAVGTGRVALPLSERGVAVHGIDLSEAMLACLRAKPGAERIGVTVGDMTTTRVGSGFALVYLVFNTVMNLTTQDAQVACFANAAAHLRPGGRFLVEVSVPDLQRLPRGERYRPFAVTDAHVGVDDYDVVTQGLVSHHLSPGHRASVPFRYAWPAELDLMARLAGLHLEHRWADWTRAPFTALSERHVSVWRTSV